MLNVEGAVACRAGHACGQEAFLHISSSVASESETKQVKDTATEGAGRGYISPREMRTFIFIRVSRRNRVCV